MIAIGCRAQTDPEAVAESLTLRTADGLERPATFYGVAKEQPPGVLLVHGYGGAGDDLEAMARLAQREGYAAMTFTMRGHGESTAYKNFTTADWMGAINDIEAAYHAMVKGGVSADDIVVAGVDIGANLALNFAVEQKEVPAVVLISPGKTLKGVPAEGVMAQYGNRPALLIACQGDPFSATTCTILNKEAEGQCEYQEYAGTYSGIKLVQAIPDVNEYVVRWLRPILSGDANAGKGS